jgi:hypothetical protein
MFACCCPQKAGYTIIKDESKQKKCCTKDLFYKITLIIGAAITIVGALALASLFMPQGTSLAPFFSLIGKYTTATAGALNADPIFLTAFVFSIGASTAFVSFTMLATSKCRKEKITTNVSL